MTDLRPHPAKFTDLILDNIVELLPQRDLSILDPFAGIGRVHELRKYSGKYYWDTVGIELEKEWADYHPHTLVGDSLHLDRVLGLRYPQFNAIVTSPCYGNRMADQYDGSGDRCVTCQGAGSYDVTVNGEQYVELCEDCDHTGLRPSRRHTYRIDLGRELSPGSSAALQWGRAYKIFHRRAWAEVTRVCKPNSVFILNIKDHVRKGKVARVTDFHVSALQALGWRKVSEVRVGAPGNRHGENYELRVDYESVIRFDLEVTW